MTATISPAPSTPTRTAHHSQKRSPATSGHSRPANERRLLGQYTDSSGHSRKIVARAGAGGSLLVIDRDSATLGDRRLVAHLACDEPVENARLVCEQYLADENGRWCRAVTAEDLKLVPYAADDDFGLSGSPVEVKSAVHTEALPTVDRYSRGYRLELVPTRMSIPEMRWQQHPPQGQLGPARVVSVRDVVAALESYEPIRTLTRGVLARYKDDSKVSVSALRDELARLCASHIVLNRGLREAVRKALATGDVSMSEIAIRCGRVKHDSRGNLSGEASWLSRRLGLTPEGGEAHATPWIHSDVLALISRRGLDINPQDVELG